MLLQYIGLCIAFVLVTAQSNTIKLFHDGIFNPGETNLIARFLEVNQVPFEFTLLSDISTQSIAVLDAQYIIPPFDPSLFNSASSRRQRRLVESRIRTLRTLTSSVLRTDPRLTPVVFIKSVNSTLRETTFITRICAAAPSTFMVFDHPFTLIAAISNEPEIIMHQTANASAQYSINQMSAKSNFEAIQTLLSSTAHIAILNDPSDHAHTVFSVDRDTITDWLDNITSEELALDTKFAKLLLIVSNSTTEYPSYKALEGMVQERSTDVLGCQFSFSVEYVDSMQQIPPIVAGYESNLHKQQLKRIKQYYHLDTFENSMVLFARGRFMSVNATSTVLPERATRSPRLQATSEPNNNEGSASSAFYVLVLIIAVVCMARCCKCPPCGTEAENMFKIHNETINKVDLEHQTETDIPDKKNNDLEQDGNGTTDCTVPVEVEINTNTTTDLTTQYRL